MVLRSTGVQLTGLTIDWRENGLPWRPTRSRGVVWLPLHVEEHSRSGPTTVLIRMDPGCAYPRHRHLALEEVFILQGGYRDETGPHRGPCYLRNLAGSVHAPVALGDGARPAGPDNPACVLFAVAHGGVVNLDGDEA